MQQNGFTLVELLAAMVAGSLLLVALGNATAMLGAEVRRTAASDEIAALARQAELLDSLLAHAVPRDPTDQANLFEITPTSLDALVPPPAALGPVGPVRLSLRVRRGADGDSLILGLASADRRQMLPASVRQPIILASGYRRILIAGPAQVSTGDAAPANVATIGLTNQSGQTRRISLRARMTSGGYCRFDPVVMACR